ncbi:unnamed protein product [Cuscuta campestris]|uniref:Embryo-specific protein ATS3A n=2 Tax=Cuscuta sect. Cleistogrammica TaxID=1824901 RepID=A0A484LLR1_9ASTE|nr:hypothetical protein DM860_004186 [Cuscuta australis]VFQ77199.1 unnamed protein product [Cuscuta campestris]
MTEKPSIILLLTAIIFFLITTTRASRDLSKQPNIDKSFTTNNASHKIGSSKCSYTVSIKTSCSSVKYTRDKISLSFGDSYRNEVYAPRLDDPHSKTFERCSKDTFQIQGPCMYDICYLYLYRVGSDGWKPETVTVYSPNHRSITFKYNKFVPRGVWYGFNECNSVSSSAAA